MRYVVAIRTELGTTTAIVAGVRNNYKLKKGEVFLPDGHELEACIESVGDSLSHHIASHAYRECLKLGAKPRDFDKEQAELERAATNLTQRFRIAIREECRNLDLAITKVRKLVANQLGGSDGS
jgi:hypothetical protein